MGKYNWQSNIETNIIMLRILGLWPKGNDNYTPGFYTLYATIILTCFLLCPIFFQTVNIYFIRTNLAAVTGTVYILLVEMLVAFKVYYMVTNVRMLKQLLRILDTDMFQPTNSTQISAIEANIWFWKMIYKAFLYMCIGTNLFWAVYPLLDKSEGERRLPFLAWYPFGTSASPVYEIIYVYQIFSVGFMTTLHVNMDALVAALNVFNGSQFDILCDNLRNIHKLGEDILKSIVYCVCHHKEILSFADKSNKFLNWILLMQFFVSSFSIGITMFQLTVVAPLSNEFYTLASYGIAITVQVFMYCWFGNEVEVKSGNIAYTVFQCEWTDFSEEIKKNLLFFAMRAQKPVKLSALNLFYLSLDTFMRILKTSWSYFALLHQVSSRK